MCLLWWGGGGDSREDGAAIGYRPAMGNPLRLPTSLSASLLCHPRAERSGDPRTHGGRTVLPRESQGRCRRPLGRRIGALRACPAMTVEKTARRSGIAPRWPIPSASSLSASSPASAPPSSPPPPMSSLGGAQRRPEDPGQTHRAATRVPKAGADGPGSPDRRAARLSSDDSKEGGAVHHPVPPRFPSTVVLGRSEAETRGPRAGARSCDANPEARAGGPGSPDLRFASSGDDNGGGVGR